MFGVTEAKARVNIGALDTSKDTLLKAGLNAALAIAENYCDRFFVWKSEKVEFIEPRGPRLQLKRYPITRVVSVGEQGDPNPTFDESMWKVHNIYGYLTRGHGRYNYTHTSDYQWHNWRVLEVQYEGGYKLDDLPADLELALWGIFDVIWNALNGSNGGGAVGNLPAGAIASVNIPDVGSVSFTQNSAVAAANVHLAGNPLFGQYGPYFHLLDTYRDEPC